MNTLFLDERFLIQFLKALWNGKVDEFVNEKRDVLDKLDHHLKKVSIPMTSERYREHELLCQFICQHFLLILNELSNPFCFKLNENSLEDQFRRNLLSANLLKTWKEFFENHAWYIDQITYHARHQNIMSIVVKWNGGKRYGSFGDAFYDRRPIKFKPVRIEKSGCLFDCCFPLNKKGHEQLVQQQLSSATLSTDCFFDTNCRSVDVHTTQPISVFQDLIPAGSDRQDDTFEVSAFVRSRENSIRKSRNEKKKTNDTDLTNYENRLNAVSKTEQPNCSRQQSPSPPELQRAGVHRTPSTTSTVSNWSIRRNKMDESFLRKLKDQKARHDEEMRKIREERERLNREAEEDLRKLKEESTKRMLFFFQCVTLKLRWEEQEHEWDDWFKTVRSPVQKVKIKFIEITTKPLSMLQKKFSGEGELKSEFLKAHKYVLIAYDKLVFDFGKLSQLAQHFEDKLFIRVALEKISTVATKLCLLLEAIEDFTGTESSFSEITICEANVDAREIPSASGLRRICETASPESYRFVSPPRQPKTNPTIITEI